MNLSYDTEQIILADSAEKFLSSRCSYASFQKIAQGAGWDRELWSEFAELGWLGVAFAEADGGIGAGPVEVAILMEAFGRHLVLAPYLSSIVLGGGIVAKLGTADQRRALLGPVIAGKSWLAFAPGESDTPVEAQKTASGFVLSGTKKTVLGAAMAEILLVTARLGDRAGVFIVPAKASGVTMRGYRMVDGARAADVELFDVIVPADALLGGNDDAANAIEEIIDRGIAALSSDAVGAMSALVSATVEYTKTRVQFGQPIATFQVLQHRMVDMKVKEEEARASCLFRDAQPRWPSRPARACLLRRQSQNRTHGTHCRTRDDPASWRHRHDRRAAHRRLCQTPHGLRNPLWQHPRASPSLCRHDRRPGGGERGAASRGGELGARHGPRHCSGGSCVSR